MKFRYLFLGLIILCLLSPVSATIVGIRWNTSNSSPSAITYIDINGNPMDRPNFDMTLPWSGMRRINISTTQYQTMVTVPKFWYNGTQYTIGGNTYNEWWVSDTSEPSLKVHPAFISNYVELPSFLIGAFEGSVYNVTTSSYNMGDFAGVNTSLGGDMLSSVAGSKPTSGLNNTITLPYFRNLSHNRGTGWELQNFNQISAIQLLYIIEYADLNSQSTIGTGVSQITDDGSTNMALNTGYTDGVGVNASQLRNTSGEAVITHYKTGQTTYPNSYRGVENVFGNIWKWVDGVNIKANRNPWIADHDFASDTFSHPYVDTGFTLAATNNYEVSIAFSSTIDYAFLPLTVGGAANQYMCDYYYQTTGNRAALLGGSWDYGASAGTFDWYLYNVAAYANRKTGARLSYIPNGTALTDVNYTFSPANASFTQNVTGGQDRVAVAFTNESTGYEPLTYEWHFTDVSGNNTPILFSNATSPEHMFGWGNYSINLTVVNTYSFDYAYSWVNVSHLESYITTNITAGPKPLTVMFNDTSFGGVTASRLWEFGDGSTSLTQNLTYVYTTAGVYTVNLTVSNIYGSDTSQQSITVYASPPLSLDANFAASNVNPALSESITFTDTSIGSPTNWNWSFGDGTNATIQNPTHAYASTGLKTVFLTVGNVSGSFDTETKVNYINVTVNGTGSANTEDIVMAGLYTLTITVTSTKDGLAIPDVAVADSTGQNATTNTAGVAVLTEPYSTAAGSLIASGYVSRAWSIVVDNDTWVTYQMMPSAPAPSTVIYIPQQVRFRFYSQTGDALDGMYVSATPLNFTAPVDWTQTLFGISSSVNINGTTTFGYTGSDGSWASPMLASFEYRMHVEDAPRGVLYNFTLYPSQTEYVYTIPINFVNITPLVSTIAYSIGNATINSTYEFLNMSYVDSAAGTTYLQFIVYNQTGEAISTTTYTGAAANSKTASITLQHANGETYRYGIYASQGTYGWINQTKVLTFEQHVALYGTNPTWIEFWLAVGLIVLFGAGFSIFSIRFGMIATPLLAYFFEHVLGWFTIGIGGDAAFFGMLVLGVISYIRQSENKIP